MTSNQSDLRESMDADTTGSSPPDQSVKFELNQTLVNHLGASVALSIMAGLALALALARFGTEPSPAAIIWTSALITSHLLLWLVLPRYANPGTTAIAAAAVYSLLWTLAGPLFISTSIIVSLTAICPLMYLQAP